MGYCKNLPLPGAKLMQFFASLGLIFSVLNIWRGTEGWSYHYSTKTMDWEDARNWCRQNYTDMVAIQNKEEISHLHNFLPKPNKGYYWIGMRKTDGIWTWVGTNKRLSKKAENWASNEPNNGGNNEDCVEMYIKRGKDDGKWNDMSCSSKNTALCYTASCKNDSCISGQGECVETINDHTCSCFEGFYGERCEHVVKCKPEDITTPHHGSVQCSHPNGNFSYDSQCEYLCKEGYKIKGTSVTRCTSTKEWSSRPPTCEFVQCPELTEPQKGNMQCHNPLGKFSYQSNCEFVCKEGYTLGDSSSSTLFCGANGHWNASQPYCKIVKCKPEDITTPDHGSVQCSNGSFSYDSNCEYSCEEGYKIKGSRTTKCTSTKEWSSRPPTCELVQCPELMKPLGGTMLCHDPKGNFSYQSTCDFVCDEGYTLRDSSSSTLFCGITGHWNDSQPNCEIVKCKPEDITTPDHGSVQCSNGSFSYDSNCEYNCEEGYKMKGSRTTRCTSTKEWSSRPPTCELVQCPELMEPLGGTMLCHDPKGTFSYQSTCDFVCDEGYTLRDSSSSTLFCGITGHWNDSQPNCEIIKCKPEDITTPDHGSVQCSHPNGGFSYDSKCKFSCEEGYKVKGSSTTRCTSTKEWSSRPPTCELIQCPALENAADGLLNCTSNFSYGSMCIFSCAEGYHLRGASEISCTETAEWSQETPHCEAHPESLVTEVTLGVAATVGSSGLLLALWILKKLRRNANKFDLNSNSETEDQPQVYKNSISSLI